MKFILPFTFMIILPGALLAQTDLVVEGEVEDAEIVIEKDREIKLKKEVKLYEFIKWQPEREEFELGEKEFEAFDYELALEPIAFTPAQVVGKPKESIYHQYAKFGFGNYGSPIADVSLVLPGATRTVAGLNYKHLSFASGEVDGENSASSFNEFSVYGIAIWDKIKLKPEATYRHEKNYWYGYPTGTVVNREDIKRGNNYIDFGVSLLDNNTTDKWSYDWRVGLENFNDNWSNKENTFSILGETQYDNKIFLQSDVKFVKYETDSSVSRLYYRVLPYYRLGVGDLTVDAGVSVSGHNDQNSAVSDLKVFPYLNATYPVTSKFELFTTLDGGIQYNSMYSLAQLAPYIDEGFAIANSEDKWNVTGGIRGNLTSKIGVQAKVNYRSLVNMPVLINNATDQSRLDVVYDTGEVGVFNFGLSSKYQIADQHDISLGFDLYNYQADQLAQIYHRPTTELKVKGNHLFFKKLSYQWQFALQSGIQAYDPTSDVDVELDPIPKLDMMVHYQITDRLGSFVSGENIISQNYTEYLFYPQRGVMLRLGASYRF